jgi:2-methylcitrate dehydratase PrpD
MTLLHDIADAILRDQAPPPEERALQRLHVFDAVIAGFAGVATPEAHALRSFFVGEEYAPRAALFAAVTRLSETDDIHLPSCITPSAVTVPTALALASQFDAVPQAIGAATALMIGFGEAIDGARVLAQGIWPTYFAAPLGACAVAARLCGLDRERTAHALALGLVAASPSVGRPAEANTSRWFLFASAVEAGVRAAHAARAGLTGDLSLLDNDWLERMRGVRFERERLRGLSGPVYASLGLKPYCMARQCLAAGQALREVMSEGVTAPDIAAIRVRVPPAYAQMISRPPESASRSSTIAGVPLQLAALALRPDSRFLVDRTDLADDESLRMFASRVSVVADEGLARFYPENWPAEIEVDTPRGTVVKRVVTARGDAGDRLGEAELTDKASRVLEPIVDRETSARWIAMASEALDGSAQFKRLQREFSSWMMTAPRIAVLQESS